MLYLDDLPRLIRRPAPDLAADMAAEAALAEAERAAHAAAASRAFNATLRGAPLDAALVWIEGALTDYAQHAPAEVLALAHRVARAADRNLPPEDGQ